MIRSPSCIPWLFAGAIVLSIITPSAFGQWDNKKKRGFTPCFIRPDVQPPSSLGVGGIGQCGAPAPAPAPVAFNPFGGRSIGFGSLFTGGTFGNRFCGPRSLIVSTPAYCQEQPFYPSANLGQCTSGSFYQPRDVNLVAAPRAFSPQPSSVFVNNTTYVATPNYGPRTANGGGDRVVSEALANFKAQKQAARAASPAIASPQPVVRSDAEMREIESILDRGDHQFKVGNYYAAREEYTRAMVIAGEDPGVRIAFGLSETALGHYEDASRAFRQAAAAEPPLDPASIDLSQAYARPADFEADIRSLESHLARKPFDPDALFVLGFLKVCSANPIGGRAVFDRYTALHSADPSVLPFIRRVRVSN